MTGRGVRRRLAGMLAAIALVPVLLLAGAGAASAHATLLFASPTADGGVAAAPSALVLTFDGPVTLPSGALSLSDPSGTAVRLGPAGLSGGGHTMSAAIRQRIGLGVYTVTWSVIASDGDAVTGTYRFAVGTSAAGLAAPAAPSTPGALPTALARWLLIAALAGLAGAASMTYLGWRARLDTPWPPRRAAVLYALVGVVAAGVLLLVQAGGGSLPRGPSALSVSVLTSRGGLILLTEAGAFAIGGLLAAARRPGWLAMPAAVIVGAEAVRGHPHEYGTGWGLLVAFAHLAAVAMWLGALAHVAGFALVNRDQPKAVRRLWRAYSQLATVLLSAVLASGTLAALIVVPLTKLFTTGYGQLLLVKIGLVALAAALALAARLRLRAHRPVLPAARLEAGTLAVVLVVAVTLTVAAPPRTATGDLPFAPAATGPVVAAGGRAGQIGVTAEASTGQLVLRLAAPGADASQPTTGYQLAAVLATPTGTARALALRGCGTGCYFVPVTWTTGTSVLTLTAGATGWHGGQATLALPWPPHSGTGALRTLAAALKSVSRLTVYERVTSDTTGPTSASTLHPSGAYFLNAEPYSSGQAPYAELTAGPGTGSTLMLDYPAENITVRLTLNTAGQLTSETLTDPDHLTTRTFAYPETH
jgi:copper transport protein